MLRVIDQEGPVEIERLCKAVARSFGIMRVRQSRLDALLRVVPRDLIRRGPLGTFVWPSDLDPTIWDAYRVAGSEDDRSLDETSPEEISNAMADFARRGRSMSVDELIEHMKSTFGIKRLSANNRQRFEDVLAWSNDDGRLQVEDDRVKSR